MACSVTASSRRVMAPWRPIYRAPAQKRSCAGWQRCVYCQHLKHVTGLVEVYDRDPSTRKVVNCNGEGLGYDARRLSQVVNAKVLDIDPGYKRAKDGLLSHRKIPVAQQKICNHNARESRFLRLPVEIRERIYELVIGGHHIQIEYKPHEHRWRQKNKVKYHEHIVGGLWYFNMPNQPHKYRNRPYHSPLGGPAFEWEKFDWPGRYNTARRVALLPRVCRQLHQETSLLLFELNLFSFANNWVMRKWLQTLKPLQKRSMRRICFPLAEASLTKTHQEQLSGLNETFCWSAKQNAVVYQVLGSSGFQKLVSVPMPRRTWIEVEDADHDESEDDQEYSNPYQGPQNDDQVVFDNRMIDENDEDSPELADVLSGKYEPEAVGTPEPSGDQSVASDSPSAVSSESLQNIDSDEHDPAAAATFEEWQRRVEHLFSADKRAHPNMDSFEICLDAGRATSFDFSLATMVVDHMLSACGPPQRREQGRVKARVPNHVPGCWTEEDDNLLMKSTDAEDWEQMEKKHGREACDRRFDFLEAWDRVHGL